MIRSRPSIQLSERLLTSLPETPVDLFPLSLSAFEKFLIWDETPQQPLNSFIELHFLDPLQTSVMEEAIAAAVRVHPMLACTVQEVDGQLCWIHHPNFKHNLHIEPEHSPLKDGCPVALNLFNEPGVRFWYREDADGKSRILLQLHHATSDGVGIRRFLIDVMNFYAQATAPENFDPEARVSWNKVDHNLLKRRADFSDSFGGVPTQPLTFWQRLKNAWYFHFQLPSPLKKRSRGERAACTCSTEKVESSEPLEHLVMDRVQSEAILEKARLEEVNVNSLALALLFETCSLWNEQHAVGRPHERFRILMPYDLRSRVDLRMSATNRLSFAFLGRTRQQCADTHELVRSINSEIQSMKATQLPMDFLNGLEAAVRHPRMMRWGMRRSRNMATAVLTYAGDISRGMQRNFPEHDGARLVGDARLDKILAAPPARDNTHLSLGLCVNWGQLCISAAWNRDGLSRKECAELLKLYESRWLAWLKCSNQQ